MSQLQLERTDMNLTKNKFLRIALLSVAFSTGYAKQESIKTPHFMDILFGYAPGVWGAFLTGSCALAASQSEEEIVSNLIQELHTNIEKRRAQVDAVIKNLQQSVVAFQVISLEANIDTSIQKKQAMDLIDRASQEYALIDLDYENEYVRIRPRARFLKVLYSHGIMQGGGLMFFTLFYHVTMRTFFANIIASLSER